MKEVTRLRASKLINTWGPGALLDLPDGAWIVRGLEGWEEPDPATRIDEPRLAALVEALTGAEDPDLYPPPAIEGRSWETPRGVRVERFPRWFLVHPRKGPPERARRLVHARALDDRGRYERNPVVPVRFVRACPRGHVDDIDWRTFVHRERTACQHELELVQTGETGDLAELLVRCGCGANRRMSEASDRSARALGTCTGRRPWLGWEAREACGEPARLLVRSASHAWFPVTRAVLSIPQQVPPVVAAVRRLKDQLSEVRSAAELAVLRRLVPPIRKGLEPFTDEEVLEALETIRRGTLAPTSLRPPELEAILAAPEGFDEDVPADPHFHARRLPDRLWRRDGRYPEVEAVVLLHRLRVVQALAGFTRFDAPVSDPLDLEAAPDVKMAALAEDPTWFPAIEHRGEGLFLLLHAGRLADWLAREAVGQRAEKLAAGHEILERERKRRFPFPGARYVLAHSLSHLLIGSLATRCGYPMTGLAERLYVLPDRNRVGILIYTTSAGASGTLGGLLAQGRHLVSHLDAALAGAGLCSHDPDCAWHDPAGDAAAHRLLGAACHGCLLLPETTCEARNAYLDRALVAPVMGLEDAAFFGGAR